MSTASFLVTGASGQLGRRVVAHLLRTVPAAQVTVLVRAPAADWARQGVRVALGDYDRPDTLEAALRGVRRLLLISSNAIGQRVAQHRNVVDAAQRAGVELLAYTSVLHAPDSPLGLAAEHRQSEAAIEASGLPHVLLRNGWYTENFTGFAAAALAQGAVLGSSGEGRVSAASRDDYAAAAARVLTLGPAAARRVYELAGDAAFTLAEYTAELARQSGRPVAYRDMTETDYRAALVQAGLPASIAALLADSSRQAAGGTLCDDGRQLSQLIGRPTTPLRESVAEALRSSVVPG